MTNQEAIETLKTNYPDACFEQLREAVDTAISALQVQDVPDTNVGDTISRQAAIALAKDICVPIKDGTVYKHRCIDPEAIKELPSECNVIYCRDCIFYSGHRCQATRGLDDWRNQDDYCSRAERI